MGPGKQAKVVYRYADMDEWVAKFQFASTSEYEAGLVRPRRAPGDSDGSGEIV
jgi:hypothetical protein